MRKIGRTLLTGRTGFIGGAIAAELSRRGVDLTAPSKSELNLLDPTEVLNMCGRHSFDTVLHFASKGVQADANDPSLISAELAMARALVPLVRQGGLLFFAGSVSEYGYSGNLKENMDCSPATSYGRAKLVTGEWLRKSSPALGISTCHARIFGAFGPGENASRLLPTVRTALARSGTVLLSDGKQIRDFVYIKDVVEATLRLISLPVSPECVNLGTGIGISVRDVVERLCRDIGADSALLHFGERKRSPHDMDFLVADTTRLKQYLDWVPPQRILSGVPLTQLLS